ncbi:MAG: lipopolysaccharide biosynthesis protein [Anaerolineae bacterium]|nr:lipopolysaccharide biosynthesis protein [Anaerolineae bacterium]
MARLIVLRLLESYFRHRWLNLLPVVLLLGVGIAYYSFFAEPVYIVRGVLYVQQRSLLESLLPLPDEPFTSLTPAEATATEINELLQTSAFVRAIIANTDLEAQMSQGGEIIEETIEEVREAVWADAQGQNQVLVAAAHEHPLIAYQLSQGMVDSYIQWRINSDREESAAAQAFFAELIAGYRDEVDAARAALQNYLDTHPAPFRGERPPNEQIEINRLEGEITLAQTRFANALDKEEDARLAMARAEGNVRRTYYLIDAPSIPVEPATSLRRVARSLAIFGGAGVLLSLLLITGGALLDRTVRFPLDLEQGSDVPVLAMVPADKPAQKQGQELPQPQKETEPAPAPGRV